MLRYSMDQVTSREWPFDKDIAYYQSLGIPAIAVNRRKLEAFGIERGLRLLRDSGMKVVCYLGTGYFTLSDASKWPKELETAKATLALAAEMQSESILLMTGTPAKLSYEEAESRFLSILEKLLPMAEEHKMPLVLEPVGSMYLRLGYIHTLQDGLDLTDKVNSPWLKLCFEMSDMWIERRLYENIATRVKRIGLVQICDVVPGMHDYSRIALGDGVVPIERIIRAFQQAGYTGYYDIEMLGPEVEKMGYEETMRRSMEWVRRRDGKLSTEITE